MGELKGTEFNMDLDIGGFEQEMYLCRWLEDNLPKNPKKLAMLLISIRPECPVFMQQGFFRKALISSNLMGHVKKVIARSKDVAWSVQKIIDRGDHGMIFHGEVLHGINLRTNQKWLAQKDGKWTPEDEEEISCEVVKNWMVTHRLKEWSGRTVLFANFGFSGIPYNADWEIPDDQWEELQVIWKKEDDAKIIEELTEYMAKVGEEK